MPSKSSLRAAALVFHVALWTSSTFSVERKLSATASYGLPCG